MFQTMATLAFVVVAGANNTYESATQKPSVLMIKKCVGGSGNDS